MLKWVYWPKIALGKLKSWAKYELPTNNKVILGGTIITIAWVKRDVA